MTTELITDSNDNVAFGYIDQQSGDVISNSVMAEIARRLLGKTTTDEINGALFVGALPPLDKTRLWLPQDTVTSLPIGPIQQWDNATQSWIVATTITAPEDPVPVNTFQEVAQSITANGTYTFTWPEVYDSASYTVAINAIGNPGNAKWWKVNQDPNTISVEVSSYSVTFSLQAQAQGDITPATT